MTDEQMLEVVARLSVEVNGLKHMVADYENRITHLENRLQTAAPSKIPYRTRKAISVVRRF